MGSQKEVKVSFVVDPAVHIKSLEEVAQAHFKQDYPEIGTKEIEELLKEVHEKHYNQIYSTRNPIQYFEYVGKAFVVKYRKSRLLIANISDWGFEIDDRLNEIECDDLMTIKIW